MFRSRLQRLKQYIKKKVSERSYLPIALSGAICFALILTFISVSIYAWDGSSKLDLSRPGYENQRAQVLTTEQQTTNYDTTSPVTRSTISSFLSEYDGRTHELSQYGDFNDQEALSDAVLQINDN